jgi:hypothetical protein
MVNDEDFKAIITGLRDRQNAFEEQMMALRHEMRVEALRSDARWSEMQTTFKAESARNEARWTDAQAAIHELFVENRRILNWLEGREQRTNGAGG